MSVLDINSNALICASPQGGGIEDVGYEDWSI